MAINPLQSPVNYLAAIPKPDLGAFLLQGLQLGSAMRDISAKRADEQRAEEARKQYSADLQNAIANPSQKTWADMIAKYPQQREAFKESAKMYGEERITNEFWQGAEISNALEINKPEVAKEKLSQIIEAKKNSGESFGVYKQALDAIEAGNTKGAQAITNFALSMMDPDKFSKIGEERRKEELQPGALEKQAADLGLTREQTNKVMVETKKLGAETAKTALELEALKKTGGVDPAKSFEYEDKLRKEYIGLTKDFRDVQSAFQRIQLSENTAAGDIALIFNYMKMLDPGSVVREGEFATAQNATGVPDRIQNAYNRALSGERLSPDQRKQFSAQAEKLYTGAEKQEADIRKGYERIAKANGLNKDNIFMSPEGPEKPQPAGQTRASYQPGQAATSAPRTVTVDY